MLHYFKFFNFYFAVLFGLIAIWFGGNAIYLGFVVYIAFYVLGDAFLGDDLSEPPLLNAGLLKAMLYSALPLSCCILATALALVSTPSDPLPQLLYAQFNIDINAFIPQATTMQTIVAIPFLALMLGGVATVVAHELVHRVGNPVAVCVGRWLLAFSFDANFSIEHVYNHHVKVATQDDPATAPRGRDVYTHFVIAFIGTQKAGWHIECKRLKRSKLPKFSLHNKCIRGWLMSVFLALVAFSIAGVSGIAMFVALGISTKFTLEIVNYMEHYGLVRCPHQPVRPRHSWNSNRRISCWTMFNLPRHSHHHAQGAVPFEKLKALQDSPQMVSGYISTMMLALIPPLWFRIMEKKLAHWDEHFASDREKEIIAKQLGVSYRSHSGDP